MNYKKFNRLFERKHIEIALNIVFNEYLNDDYTYRWFKEFPIKKVEEDLHSTFFFILEGKKQEAKRSLFKIGKYFFENSLPFSFFYDTIAKIKLQILKSGKAPCRDNADELEEIFDFVEDTFSYGFLSLLIIQDKNWIRDELRLLKNNESTLRVYIRDHLIWVNKLLEDIRKLRDKNSIELNPNKCDFGRKLNSGALDPIFTEKYKEIIDNIHKQIHKSASEIYFFIEKRKFKNLLIEYIHTINNVERLLSTIGTNLAVVAEVEARIDPLTGVFNRRSMEVMLLNQLSIAKLTNTKFAVGLIDIDNFKILNDTYGHLTGDCVLRNVADTIRETLRKSDFVFRYGGEEFVVLLPFTDRKNAKYVMEKVRKNIEEKIFNCEDTKLKITVSIGVSEYTERLNSIDKILDIADKNLYKAKNSGKNKVVS